LIGELRRGDPLKEPRTGLELLGLVLGLGLVAGWSLQRLGLEGGPPVQDEARHLANLLDLRQALASAAGLRAWLVALLTSTRDYPPLVYLLTLPWLGAAPSMIAARAAVLCHGLVAAGLACWLARRPLGRSGAWGFLLITVLSPLALSYSRRYFLDAPLAAAVALGWILLLRTERFQRRGAAALFGLAAGLGLLVKWSWLFFLGPAALVVALLGLRRGRGALGNGLLAAAVAALIAGPWYALAWPHLAGRFRAESWSLLEGGGAWQAVLRQNLQTAADAFPGLLPLLLLAVPLAAWRARSALGLWGASLGAAAGALLALSLSLPHDPRYLLPLLPMLACACCCWWPRLPRPAAALAGILLLLGLGSALLSSVAPASYAARRSAPAGGPAMDAWLPYECIRLAGLPFPVTPPPLGQDWSGLQAAMQAVERDCAQRRCAVAIFNNRDQAAVQARAVILLARLGGSQVRWAQGEGLGAWTPKLDQLGTTHALLVPCAAGGRAAGGGPLREQAQQALDLELEPLGSWDLPQGCQAWLGRVVGG